MNVSMLLDMAAETFPDRVAVQCEHQTLTYAELRRAASVLAKRIGAAGCNHVALLDTNGLAAPVTLFAAAYAGVPYVPLSYRLARPEIEELLSRIAPAVLVARPLYRKDLSLPKGISCIDGDDLPALGLFERARESEAPAILLFTSGTTGKPKAAVLRHENVLSYILGAVELGCASEEEATLVSVPPYHIAGAAAVLSSTYAGRRIVMLPNFAASDWLELCARERITHAFLVPTMLARILDDLNDRPRALQFPALRAIAYGGGKMPLPIIERAVRVFAGVDFTNAYGLTETSSTICLLTPEDHREAALSEHSHVRQRLASVGRPLPAVELQVRDEAGRVLAPHEAGLIYVRGAQVSGEYQGAGSLLDAEGWFPTRDRGWIDADGYVFLDGRADDVIVRGGENISPGEIESVLLSHPGVVDAAVVGVHSEHWGEAVAAAVVCITEASATEQELQNWVRERLRSSRVPERIVFMSELPYNETGKLLRRVVRKELQTIV